MSDMRESFKQPKFLSKSRARGFKTKLFYYPITQDILVNTEKFTCSGEARINCMQDSYQGDDPFQALEPYSRTSKGLSVGELVGGP